MRSWCSIPILAFAIAGSAACNELSVDFIRQFGTPEFDTGLDITSGPFGSLFIGGSTDGDLGGSNLGGGDAFVTHISTTGETLWTSQFGTFRDDGITGIANHPAGGVIVAGSTRGTIEDGTPFVGTQNPYVAKLDGDGSLIWTDQLNADDFGSTFSNAGSWDIATDNQGNSYTAGRVFHGQQQADAFLVKHDPNGELEWLHQFGNEFTGDQARAVAVDALGDVYLTGWFGSNSFVSKLGSNGEEIWHREFGTSGSDLAFGIAVDDESNAYVTGGTTGSINGENQGGDDVFVLKIDATGDLDWARQFGSPGFDTGSGIAFGNDSLLVKARTDGTLFGEHQGFTDVALVQIGLDGSTIATTQYGTAGNETSGWHTSFDESGQAWLVTGWTDGVFADELLGNRDAYVARIPVAVPEPDAHLLVFLIGIWLLRFNYSSSSLNQAHI